MPAARVEKDISVIASRYFQPLADLLSRLLLREYAPPDRIGSGFSEGGYSAASIILLVAAIESLVQRDRYFYRKENPTITLINECAPDYTKNVLCYRRSAHIKELFEVRNAIAHNHIWELEYTLPAQGGRRHKRSTVVPGTHRLSYVPPPNVRVPRTKILRMNLQPTRLDRTDVDKALAASLHLLEYLARKGNNPINVARETFAFNGVRMSFAEFAESMHKTI